MNAESANALELALAKAATEPAHRPEFYRLLLESQVFVLGHTQSGGEGVKDIAAGESLSIQNWQKNDGTPVIPFFASLEALQRAIKEQQSYLALPARSLFEITRGATLVLNPASDHAKAGSVAADTAPDGQAVDFVKVVRGEDGLSGYLIETVKPFYQRTPGSKLKSLFGFGA